MWTTLGRTMATGRGGRWAWAVAGWLALAVRAVPAEPPKVAGESPRTAQRLAEAADLENQRRWADAVELYLRIIDEAGDDLVPTDDRGRRLLPARAIVHRRIAARPEVLGPYRERVESRAVRLLEQGAAGRDPQPLEQLVDQYFCSRSAEKALDLLGDLACERGEFERARGYWRMLEPDSPSELRYPNVPQGQGLPAAKQILARLLSGDRSGATAGLAEFRKVHPAATGHLAGRDGNLAAILDQMVESAETVRVPSPTGIGPSPSTFGGDATRGGVLAGALPPFSPEPFYGPIKLAGGAEAARSAQRPLVRSAGLVYHPVIAHGQVFVADARRVLAYDLVTGQLAGQFDLFPPGEPLPPWATSKPPIAAGTAFTLTTAGDRVYARLGPPQLRAARGEGASVLVCLQWRAGQPSPAERLRLLWRLPVPNSTDGGEAQSAWEGTPVVRDGRLYVAMTRVDGTRAATGVLCYAADDPAAGPIWRKEVYEAAGETAERSRLHLVTLAGPHAIYCSHAGLIVALEAATGRRAWAVRYPAREPGTTHGGTGPRDPAPCVFADGRLYAAPADADRVFCIDAATGSLQWASDPLDVAHLLGVVRGRVICTLGGFHAGLCALDAATGQRITDWGYRVAGADALAPFGRGLLCGDRVFWPTRAAGIMELRWDGTAGYPPAAFRELPGGNLAYGDGSLVVATGDRLHVLVGRGPEPVGPPHRLGRAADEDDPNKRHDVLLWRADMLRNAGRPAGEVRAVLEAATRPEFSPERRFVANVRRADFEVAAEGRSTAESVARAVDRSPELRDVSIRDANGVIWSARQWADETLGERVRDDDPTPPRKADAAVAHGSLRFPLQPAWHLALDQGREWALPPDEDAEAGRVFVAGRRSIASRDVSGANRWRRDLSFTPLWVTVADQSVLVAGDDGAAGLAVVDGRVIWEFRVPDVAIWFDRPGWHNPAAVPPAGDRLNGFRWAGGRLIARLGARSLVALDAATGTVLWQRTAPFAAEFHPAFYADARCVVSQSSDGRRWAVDAATGGTLHSGPAPLDPWPNPPVVIDGGRLVVVEDGRLVALDRNTWSAAWTWDLSRWPSLSGAPPQTRLLGGILLVGVPRNDCYEVERLEPVHGRPVGDVMAVGGEPADLGAMAFDGERLTVVRGGELRTVDCRQNRVVDRRSLGLPARWQVEPAADGLLLWTVPAASPFEAPSPGRCLVVPSESESRRSAHSTDALAPAGLGSGGVKWVRVVGNEVIVASDGEVRGYRGANREVK